MRDVVLAESLPKLAGMDAAVPAALLKNFFKAANPESAAGAAKRKGALIYSPSYEIDDGALLEIAKSGGAVVFSFSDVLSQRGFRRAIVISKMRLLVSAARKRECAAIVCTLAMDADSLRNERELKAFAAVIGMTDVERKRMEKTIEELAK